MSNLVRRLSWATVLVVAAQITQNNLALAQRPESRAADEAALRQAGRDYLATMARGDAKAIAEFWTAEGTYTDEHGHTLRARELIGQNFMGNTTAGPQAKVSDVKIRFLSGDVAVEEGATETMLAGAATPVMGRFTALWVRQNGKWKLESLHESRTQATLNLSDRLAALEPFVGEWSGTIGPNTIQVSAQWNSGKTFLHRERSIVSDGKQLFGGTQEIGWDPVSQKIKSWVFNSDGSSGEGLWSLEGNSWIVLTSTILPDGKTSSATQVFKFTNKDTLVWKSMSGELEGHPTPNFEITLKRNPAAK